LPGLNEIIDAQSKVYRGPKGGRTTAYRQMKKHWGERIGLLARAAGITPFGPARFHYMHLEPNRRRDPSNFCAGAAKIIEDALVDVELMKNDGWKDVLGISHEWHTVIDKPGVKLEIRED
jgi:hypothetical protein